MKNRIAALLIALASLAQAGAPASKTTTAKKKSKEATMEKIVKDDARWKTDLGDACFRVMRKQGTEPAFSGGLWDNHEPGTYFCAACGLPLFVSDTKFDSGTGWPSFFQPIDKANIGEHVDSSYGMKRTEVHCQRCGGHLGHVFEDGPKPTGLRYCINSVSLTFVKKGGKAPDLTPGK